LTDLSGQIESFTAGDGYRWQYRHYVPTTQPRVQVVCIHGIQSHGGWYGRSCSRLCEAGFEVFFLDRRGSGLNEERRGDIPGFHRLLDDIAEFLRWLRQPADAPAEGRRLNVILVAISWGGKLAAALQRRHPGLVDGLALLCPGFRPKIGPGFRDRLAIVSSRLIAPGRKFPIPLDEPELFTASPRWQEYIRNDPLSLREATARFFVESARLDGYLRFVPVYVTVPVLVLLAAEDRIIDNEKTRQFVEQFATAEKHIIEYPGAHHTLEFEPEPERYLRDLISWIQTRFVQPWPGSRPSGPQPGDFNRNDP
jgi:alpha-beta hydrolase superfamily lysophospholipase